MDAPILEQARNLYKTIRALRKRVLLRNASDNASFGGLARELTLTQLTTLLVIRDRGEMTVKEFAEATSVSAPSASAMADRLVELRMVSREGSKADRRAVLLSVTSEGERAVGEMESQIHQSIVEILDKIGVESAAQWCEVFGKVQEVLDEEERERCEPGRS
ncbi:MAG: MarR family transcriptional regulator [Candidatus Hydrogenedentes bacterium]|nr:MarR family transcriptional regulator [Candidatus Hydrogenedentota bacterium]